MKLKYDGMKSEQEIGIYINALKHKRNQVKKIQFFYQVHKSSLNYNKPQVM